MSVHRETNRQFGRDTNLMAKLYLNYSVFFMRNTIAFHGVSVHLVYFSDQVKLTVSFVENLLFIFFF